MPARSADDVRIETYSGPRDNLRRLFELAEDSAAELDSYIDAGRVLVATSDGEVIGHLQLTVTGDPRQAEIKNMAVREDLQGQGVGRRLIQAAVDLVAAESVTTILVATAAADIGNLRFYQRQGFRMRSVERDAFTPATGYPPGLLIDGIELRDRVWLDRAVLADRGLAGHAEVQLDVGAHIGSAGWGRLVVCWSLDLRCGGESRRGGRGRGAVGGE
jgi:GNAT superfamily N-acetyltransferase